VSGDGPAAEGEGCNSERNSGSSKTGQPDQKMQTPGFSVLTEASVAADAGDLSAFFNTNKTSRTHSGSVALENLPATGLPETDGVAFGEFAERCCNVAVEHLESLCSSESTTCPALARQVIAMPIGFLVSVQLVSPADMQELNSQFRNKATPTNVLSFQALDSAALEGLASHLDALAGSGFQQPLGDIAICPEIVISEANAQQKACGAHLAHMVVHGLLHLLGYDHVAESDAVAMESAERAILAMLGIADPYYYNPGIELT